MSKRDYYEILGVERDADDQAIKSAYRKLAMKYHPDKNPGDQEAEATFKEINEAYEILSDTSKRQKYDQFGHAGVDPNASAGYGDFGGFGGFEDVSDIFSSFFGGGSFGGFDEFNQGASRGPRRGSDVGADVHLSFREAYTGASKEVSFYRLESCPTCDGSGAAEGSSVSTCSNCQGAGQIKEVQAGLFGQNVRIRTCPECHGTGQKPDKACPTCKGKGKVRKRRKIRVKIPAGVDTGHVMTLSGEGDIGEDGGPKGDLQLRIFVASDPVFTRKGVDVFQEIPISFTQAALGNEIQIEGLDGKVKLKVDAGTQPGTVRRISGGGFPSVRGYGKGDHYVTFVIKTPKDLNETQKEALRNFAQTMGEDYTKENKGFFGKVKDAIK
ncbi:MAG TPA: molecular chaperone DnaJ [Clostridia bacterium]|nr:molecular chaperone DnaJ [Clostridia bacterium]